MMGVEISVHRNNKSYSLECVFNSWGKIARAENFKFCFFQPSIELIILEAPTPVLVAEAVHLTKVFPANISILTFLCVTTTIIILHENWHQNSCYSATLALKFMSFCNMCVLFENISIRTINDEHSRCYTYEKILKLWKCLWRKLMLKVHKWEWCQLNVSKG